MTKTTIRNIDSDAFWEAKIYAAQTQQTMGEVISEAILHLISAEDANIDNEEEESEVYEV